MTFSNNETNPFTRVDPAESWKDAESQATRVWVHCDQCHRAGPPASSEAAAILAAVGARFSLDLGDGYIVRFVGLDLLQDSPRVFCPRCIEEFGE